MPAYDLLMMLVLAAATIFGAIKGFAWQVASLASIIASYFIAYYFRYDVAKMINAQPPWNLFLAMLLLYCGSSFAIWMVFRLVSSSIDKVKLKEFDRHMGALLGFGKGVVLCLIITMFAMTLLDANKQRAICQSRSGYYISRILAGADGILPREIDQILGPHLDRLERKLEDGRNGVLVEGPDNWGGWADSAAQGLQNLGLGGQGQGSAPARAFPGTFPGTYPTGPAGSGQGGGGFAPLGNAAFPPAGAGPSTPWNSPQGVWPR
jgi:membrane protein required for colicin V production